MPVRLRNSPYLRINCLLQTGHSNLLMTVEVRQASMLTEACSTRWSFLRCSTCSTTLGRHRQQRLLQFQLCLHHRCLWLVLLRQTWHTQLLQCPCRSRLRQQQQHPSGRRQHFDRMLFVVCVYFLSAHSLSHTVFILSIYTAEATWRQ